MELDLNACIEGDNEAWNAFCDQTTGLVIAAIRRVLPLGRTPSGAEIDDVVQAVYIKLLRNDRRLLRSYDPSRSSMSTWITLVARSVAIDALRRRSLDTRPLDDAYPATREREDTSPGELDLPLHLLTARQRLVLGLLFQDGLDVPDAARVLDVSEQTVRSTKHKALERLRAHFQATGDGDATDPDARIGKGMET